VAAWGQNRKSQSIADDYIGWTNENITNAFLDRGINVTENARHLLTFAIQSQIQEYIVENDPILFERLGRIIRYAVEDYYGGHGNNEVNFNRALYIMDRWSVVLEFPFAPTYP
jgi:hypothetical protein